MSGTSVDKRAGRLSHILTNLHRSIDSPQFAVFVGTLLFTFTILITTLLLIPPGDGPLAAFAKELKVWCFSQSPRSDELEWATVLAFYTQALILATIIWLFWKKALLAVWRSSPFSLVPGAIVAMLLVVAIGAGLFTLYIPSSPSSSLQLSQLRTELLFPDFHLLNQNGRVISKSEMTGKVAILTGVYATCNASCPMIMSQLRRVLSNLSEEELKTIIFLAATYDPENDSVPVLTVLEQQYRSEAPLYNFLTGESAEVANFLDRLGLNSKKDPETGIISHANKFILVDPNGRIAYRFSIGSNQEVLMLKALKGLIGEISPMPG